MNKIVLIVGLLLSSAVATADTLYQGTVGGYNGVGLSIGGGVGYTSTTVGYGYTGQTIGGIPYEGPNYPFGSQCCGCNTCNSCGNSYGCGR